MVPLQPEGVKSGGGSGPDANTGGSQIYDEAAIEKILEEDKDIAILCLGGVQYFTGKRKVCWYYFIPSKVGGGGVVFSHR